MASIANPPVDAAQQVTVQQYVSAGLLPIAVILSRGPTAVISTLGSALRWIPMLWQQEKVVPRGFTSQLQFQRFGRRLKDGLEEAGYADAEAAIQGSSVTGVAGAPGRNSEPLRDLTSDFDVAIGSPELLARAKELGIELRSGGSRTGPLVEKDLQALGLLRLRSELEGMVGREVNFMIYGDIGNAVARIPSATVPFLR
jgi:filamentous hemagglutinin